VRQYTDNLRYFNRVASTVYFNHTPAAIRYSQPRTRDILTSRSVARGPVSRCGAGTDGNTPSTRDVARKKYRSRQGQSAPWDGAKAHEIGGCYPGVRTSWFRFYRPKPRQQVMSERHVYTQQTTCGHSCATGCKASGMLKAGEFTFEETSYIMSRSVGKGTRSAWAASRARLGLSQSASSCSLSITGIRL
jgi:hypothetical protein